MPAEKYAIHLDLNGNEIQNAKGQNLSSTPQNVQESQFWYDTVNHTMVYYNGTSVIDMGSQGNYTFKNGIEQVSNSRDVQIKLGTSSNATVTADSSGLAVSVADASTSAKGVIEIATDTEASTGTSETLAVNPKQLATKVTANNAITGATKCKVTYDSKGLVTGGADLSTSDIPDLSSTYIAVTTKGQANGVASLDGDGKVPTAQLPSYVDDVVDSYIVSGATAFSSGWLSATSGGSALTPETGKIYVVLSSGEYLNKTYRWSGTTYVEISPSPAQATESQAGIAEIATQTEVNTGTDDTRFVTPLKLATYIANKKITATNPALTASGGVCTWTISNTIGTADVIVEVKEVSTGDTIIAGVTTSSSNVVIKFNSSSNISAGVYKAIIMG